MRIPQYINKPSKEEQQAALQSYDSLITILDKIHEVNPEIEIKENRQRIRVPLNALKLLAKILKETSKGRPVSIVPLATELTTQAAAELLGCSRPHIVKLLETGKIKFIKVGRHRRIKYEDIVEYKKRMKAEQERLISQIMDADEKDGLYDL